MFKAIAGVSAALVCMTGPQIPAAHAWDYCTTIQGARVCAQYRTDNDVVEINSSNGYIRFGIKCVNYAEHYTWEWKVFESSTGNTYTRAYMKDFSESYCEGRLGLTSQAPTDKYQMA